MTTDLIITTETDLSSTDYTDKIDAFWCSGTFDCFTGLDNHRIEYAYFSNDEHESTIVISPGRCEGYLKYKEVIFDLYRNKFNVFIIDHRGQGLSQRSLKNPHKGYVEKFDMYALDLHTFIENIVLPKTKVLPYLVGHSMGGAIAARMFQICDKVIASAVLLSPMIAINSGGLPYSFAKFLVSIGHSINKLFAPNNPWYFLSQSNYKVTPFEKNVLTHSVKRYNKFVELYLEEQALQLGGVTFQWLSEAIKNESNLFKDIDKSNTSFTIIQASDDTVVNNLQQHSFCNKLNQVEATNIEAKLIVIKDSRHELLFETDNIRKETFQYIKQCFSQSPQMLDHGE